MNGPGPAVPRALLYRYFKPITADLLNIRTSPVKPIERPDHNDEDQSDRE